MHVEDSRYSEARKRVEQRVALMVHIAAFAVVNIALFAANGAVDLAAGHFWGWGIGLAVHTAYALVDGGEDWMTRMVEREAGRRR